MSVATRRRTQIPASDHECRAILFRRPLRRARSLDPLRALGRERGAEGAHRDHADLHRARRAFRRRRSAARAFSRARRRASTGDRRFLVRGLVARAATIDVVFPLIHGTGGEDGSLQGYLEMLGLPYVGSGVTASAVGMDKVHMKQAFAAAKLPMVDYVAGARARMASRARARHARRRQRAAAAVLREAGEQRLVGRRDEGEERRRPGRRRSSTRFRFDEKVLVERGVDAREIEVAVLGNEKPEASRAGRDRRRRRVLRLRRQVRREQIAARHPGEARRTTSSEEFRRLALAAFKAIGASGFARVDFFLERGTNRLYVNEINTIPGFTNISMYPKLWEATELKYPRLIERLIDARHRARARRARRARSRR